MDYFYLFLAMGLIVVYLILRFDEQQRRKVSTMLKQTSDVQPLLMMQSLGLKLNRINEALKSAPEGDEIQNKLSRITTEYNSGHINMQTYNKQLNDLLQMVEAR
ncbi:hypothetical protein SNE25_13425 [Mucilaginibacter sabulilitoris]|uniref:Uncharacterized protein n=1 Tax=Mucilaginibacter sabulilitoris TaxID=1173583 RepID=A0ABZ0TUB8_9SPHI|nr:hypothetical protein [Mucilaginibacter sabulilitoris]WPU96519.1 hypothetical protein SNE25_13425 [Mucilaginibacter sabulilitoris]